MPDHATLLPGNARYIDRDFSWLAFNGGGPLHFIGSGDWMTRNLRERVEVVAPISDPELKARLDGILAVYWADTAKTHVMHAGGGFARLAPKEGEARFEAQAWLMEHPESLPADPPAGTADPKAGVPLAAATAKAYIGS